MLRVVLLAVVLLSVESKIAKRRAEDIRADSNPQTRITRTFNGDSFSFLIAGDNGGFPEPFYSTKLQRGVAARMADQSAEHDCKFILEIGDNFYFLGVKDIYDRRWRGTFEEVYDYPSLYIPWYPTTGNHDWHGSVQAQIDYSKISSRWTFPWYWYTVDTILEPADVKLRIIMFETTIVCGIGGSPDGVPIDEAMAEEEWAWLEKELKEGDDADYLIVTGHYPIYSAGTTGPTTPCLHERLDPLLQKYGASAYIAGHDHSAQSLVATDGSEAKYLIVGCSNFVTPYFQNDKSEYFTPEILFGSWGDLLTGCFARADVTADSMTIEILKGGEGGPIGTVELPKRNKAGP